MIKKTKFLKKFILLIIIAFTVIFFSKNSQASEGDIWLTPVVKNVKSSTNFDIEIHVDTGGKDLGGFNLYFDFTVSDVTIDTTQGTDGVDKGADGSNYILTINATDIANGHLRLAGIANSGYANGSNVHIATIHAKTTSSFSSGTTNLSLRVNELLDELSNNFTSGTITGSTITPIEFTPIYRLYNTQTGAQLYTRGQVDRDNVLNKWSAFEFTDGVPAFYAFLTEQSKLTPIYRLYNTQTGAQLYTRGQVDRDNVLNKWSAFEFTDGVPAFYTSITSQYGFTPIYRLYNTQTGAQLYTRGQVDRDNVLNKWSAFEFTDGVPAFYAPTSL